MKRMAMLVAALAAVLLVLPVAAAGASSGGIRGNFPGCANVAATIVGTSGNDFISGTHGPDVIFAGDGNDVVHGNGGSDRICGGNGNDSIYGDNGNDKAWGGPGHDQLIGNSKDDVLTGYGYKAPNDTTPDDFYDGTGFDQVFGGAGGFDSLFECLDNHPTDPDNVGVENVFGPTSAYCNPAL